MIPRALSPFGAALLHIWSSSAFAAGALHAPGGGAVRALVISIDRYPNLNEKGQLAGAVADARDIPRALTAAGAKVQTLTNGDAVRSRVVAENRLVGESKSGDLAIITYSGHGMRVRAYPRWKGLDASPFDSQIALSRFGGASVEDGHEIIVDREMRAWYARLDAKGVDVLVVMDSCYGGHIRHVDESAGQIKVSEVLATVLMPVIRAFERGELRFRLLGSAQPRSEPVGDDQHIGLRALSRHDQVTGFSAGEA